MAPLRETSNSEIRTFKECRRKWWLSYYRQLRRKQNLDAPRKPMQTGDFFHRALQYYYTPENFGDHPNVVFDELTEIIHQEVYKNLAYAEDIQKNGELCRIMLEGYFEWLAETGADSELEVLAAEQTVAVQLPNLPVPVVLRGKLDTKVRNRSTNGSAFLEHKTVQGFDAMKKTAGINEQFLMYHLLDLLDNPTNIEQLVEGAIINMARRVKRTATAKPPFYDRFTVHRSKSELRSFYTRTWATVRDMIEVELRLNQDPSAHLVHAYPNMSNDCTWKCPFIRVCRMIDQDEDQAERMLSAEYELHDPNERYQEEEPIDA